MLKRIKKDCENQRGEVMLESSFILVSVIILLMALLSISFMFYQEAMMTSVANEIAADVAKNYKFTEVEVGENISLDIYDDEDKRVKMFRMNFGKGSLERAHEDRAEDYAEWRIGAATLGLDSEDIEVDCEVTSSGIGRAYVKVTVSQKSTFFLSEILGMVGIMDEDSMFSSTVYAECVDMMGYTSMVNFTEYGSRKLHVFKGIGDFYNSVKGFIQELLD